MRSELEFRWLWLSMAWCAVAIGLSMLAPPARAEAALAERAIARTADDPELEWGDCPEFLPAGCAIAVLHGDPSKPNVDILFKVPAKAEIPRHTHTSAERMVLISGELHVTYEGQTPTRLTPGTYAYGPAARAHAGTCVSEVPCVLFIAFESPLDAIPSGAAKL